MNQQPSVHDILGGISLGKIKQAGRETKLAVLRDLKSSNRDEPPLGEGAARLILIEVKGGIVYIVSILDTDSRKGIKRGLPGGRQKGGGQETPRETAAIEALEEAGALVRLDDCFPVCFVEKANEHNRDGNDRETGGRRPVLTCAFAHYGHVAIEEMQDSDARDPRWTDVAPILETGLEFPGDRPWFLSHVIFLANALSLIGKGFRDYFAGAITDEHDLAFYGKLAQAAKDVQNFEAILDLARIDVLGVVTNIVADNVRAQQSLGQYACESLGGEKYFLS